MNRRSEMGGAVVERERFKYRRWGAGGGDKESRQPLGRDDHFHFWFAGYFYWCDCSVLTRNLMCLQVLQ